MVIEHLRQQHSILVLVMMGALTTVAQDTLPRFTLVNKGSGRIIVSWTNPYKDAVHQLSIQRSTDSSRNFKTILTLPDPTVPQNGYVDTKAPAGNVFYRLFILLDSGKYKFSPSKRPVMDTVKAVAVATEPSTQQRIQETPRQEPKKPLAQMPAAANNNPVNSPVEEKPAKDSVKAVIKPKEIPERIFFVKKRDTLIAQVGERSLKRFKDSISYRTKDTLTFSTPDTILIKPFVPKEVYKPSRWVFTEKDGNVRIVLPDAGVHKYALKFFEESNAPVFDIKLVKDSLLILDKTNFLHSGWFKFELYEDGVLKEKNKFFIPKDF